MIEGNIYRNHGFFPWALGPLGGSCRKKPCNQSKGNYLLVKTSFSDTHVVEYPTISELKSSYRSIYPVYSTIVSHSHFIPIVPYCGWISSDIHYNYSNYPELYPNDVGKITLYHIYINIPIAHIYSIYIYTSHFNCGFLDHCLLLCAFLFKKELHVDRTLNVLGSGLQHKAEMKCWSADPSTNKLVWNRNWEAHKIMWIPD